MLRSKPQSSATAAIGSGFATRLGIDFGTASGNGFAANAASAHKSVLIPGGANSLQGIADSINGARLGVAAKVAADGGKYVLELTSPTGANAQPAHRCQRRSRAQGTADLQPVRREGPDRGGRGP